MLSPLAAPSAVLTTQSRDVPSTTVSSWPSSTLSTRDRRAITQSFAPMTSHWTRPETCTWTYDGESQLEPGATGAIAWLDLKPNPHATTLSCYPDGMFSYGQTGIFSPASCPDGWTTVSLKVNTVEEKSDETTTAVCCSSDYSLDGAYCKRSVPTVLAVPIAYDKSDGDYSILTNSTTTLYSATIAVYTVHALFQENDKGILGLTDEVEISAKSHGKGLSLGAQIGIGIGVTVAVVLILGLAMFLFARRCLKRQGQACGRRTNVRDDASGESGQVASVYESSVQPFNAGFAQPVSTKAFSESSATTADTLVPLNDMQRKSHEIQALRSQQANIQRRIEELEKTEVSDGRG